MAFANQLATLAGSHTGNDYSQSFGQRLAGLGGPGTPTTPSGVISPVPSVTSPIPAKPAVTEPSPTTTISPQDKLQQGLAKYPFHESVAPEINNDVNVRTMIQAQGSHGPVPAGAQYEGPGGNIYNFEGKYLPFVPEPVRATIADHLKFLDSRGNIELGKGISDSTSASHEILNHLFYSRVLGSPQSLSHENPKVDQFNNDFNTVLKKGVNDPDGDTLYAIDQKLKGLGELKSDSPGHSYVQASDRFSFLADQVAKNGIEVIPVSLRPYFDGIVKDVLPPPKDLPPLVEQPRSLIDKITGSSTVVRQPQNVSSAQPAKPNNQASLVAAIAHNETGIYRGQKAYDFHQPSGSKALGNAMGRYQVTEGELKSYAQKFLGRMVTPQQFQHSPMMQDSYMNNKVAFLIKEGLSPAQILASHRGGMPASDPARRQADLSAKIAHYQPYVSKGLAFLNTQSPGGTGK